LPLCWWKERIFTLCSSTLTRRVYYPAAPCFYDYSMPSGASLRTRSASTATAAKLCSAITSKLARISRAVGRQSALCSVDVRSLGWPRPRRGSSSPRYAQIRYFEVWTLDYGYELGQYSGSRSSFPPRSFRHSNFLKLWSAKLVLKSLVWFHWSDIR
jgi:hypothetical protein